METRNGLVYMLFAQEVGPMVKTRYPLVGKVQYNQILGRIWKGMPETDRAKYQKKADNMNLAQDMTKQVVTKPDPQGPTPTTKIVANINDPNIKNTPHAHAVNKSSQRAFTAFSAAVRPSLALQNPKMMNDQINQLLEKAWNELGEEERYKYSRISKRRLGDYFGKFREVEMYQNNKNHEKEVIDLACDQEFEVDEADKDERVNTVDAKHDEVDEDIKIITENGSQQVRSSNKEERNLGNNDDVGVVDDLKENLEVLYPNISISHPPSGPAGECGDCDCAGLEREVSGLKRELSDKTEVIAKLVKRIRYLEDVTEYKY